MNITCATLCYVKKNGKTLMLHRIKKKNDIHQGKWNGLGGKMELGESPEECIAREVLEESGLKIKDPKFRGVLTFPAFDSIQDWIVFLFTADEFTGEMIESNEGDLQWIDDDKLAQLQLWDGDRLFIDWLKKDKFFSAKFIYDKGSLKNYTVHFY